jgi:hypothetical protein
MGELWECARAKDGGHFGNAPGPRMEAPEQKGGRLRMGGNFGKEGRLRMGAENQSRGEAQDGEMTGVRGGGGWEG